MMLLWAFVNTAAAQDVCEPEASVDNTDSACAVAIQADPRAADQDAWFEYELFGCLHSVLDLDADGDGFGWGSVVLTDDNGLPYREVLLQCDACPETDDDQLDTDCDGQGDVCDLCPDDANPSEDTDGDGIGDACDACPNDPNPAGLDTDSDGTPDSCDVCPDVADDQTDRDGDGIGDVCDPCPDSELPPRDDDGDGIVDTCGPPLRLNGGASCASVPSVGWLWVLLIPLMRRVRRGEHRRATVALIP